MGYETTLLFCNANRYGKKKGKPPVGSMTVEASFDLCKVGSGAMGDLMRSLKSCNYASTVTKQHKTLRERCYAYEQRHRKLFTTDGEYNTSMDSELFELDKKEIKKVMDENYKEENALSCILPYVYWNSGDVHSFTDQFGDLLMVATPAQVKEALLKSIREDIIEHEEWVIKNPVEAARQLKEYGPHEPYWRFEAAVRMLDAITQGSPERDWVVVLWGH